MSAHDMTATITCAGCNHGYADSALFCPNCGRPKVREAATDALVGKLLGERFQVQALLGQGGSGTIYRAEHVTLRRKVAIKVLHTELSRDDLAVERFRREATTVADIDNEHIVEIHDFGRTPDGRLYLAMELLEGETLDHVLVREKQLSVERTADILIQVGEALMEAHAIGYVHRDLRPRNVYLTQRRGKANFVKLLDFGLAKLVETDTAAPSTSLGMTFGDPRYMSPEQARGDRIDRRADIYQLGCVAYEMLTGGPPFTGSRVFDILSKQVTETPTPLPTRRPGVPLWMEAAVAKMLAKDPENRFATTSRMVEALRRGLETGEVMEDSIARRRESVPPPSVSRVMQRMGISDDGVLPPQPPLPALAAAKPDPVLEAPPRRSTGTPKVGVPIVGAPEVTVQRPVAGVIEPSSSMSSGSASVSRAKRTSSHGPRDPDNISQVWYAEGENDRAATSLAGRSETDVLYEEEPPRGRRLGIWVGLAGLLVVGGTVFALTRGGSTTTPAAPSPPPIANAGIPVDAAPSTIMESPDAAVAAKPVQPAAVAKSRPTTGTKAPSTSRPSTGSRPSSTTGGRDTSTGFVPPGTTGAGTGFEPPGTTHDVNPYDTNPAPIVIKSTPKDPQPTGPSGVDGPLDPYGGGGTPTDSPAEGGSVEQKASFFANLGTQQLASGDTGNAAASFKKALELDPRHVPAVIGMGEIALRQGLFGDAIAHLRKAARMSPRSARVFTLLGEAFLSSGNSSDAASNFKKALQIEPDNARARDGYNEASSRVPPPSD
ncbi:MAG: serine/threonine protein kinase with repeat [Myxococcales bacterium]|nr:serine/threonine protein kinase with repeat [Myxococcales bacterium]